MPSTILVHQLRVYVQNCTLKPYQWCQLWYVPRSWYPLLLTSLFYKNSFADSLGPLGFDIYCALTVDLLHEFELGVFKAVFKHLLRLLHAINPISGTGLVAMLDARYILCTVSHTEPNSSCFLVQISPNSILQKRLNPSISYQCLRCPSMCSPTFWRCPSGKCCLWWLSITWIDIWFSVLCLHSRGFFLLNMIK